MFGRIIPRPSTIWRTVQYCTKNETTILQPIIINRDGDMGKSRTIGGKILPKSHPIFDAIGYTDELNGHLALSREFANDGKHTYIEHIKRIQTVLIDIKILILKSSPDKSTELNDHIKELEEWIEEFSTQAPPYEHHIIPGGGRATAALYLARTICRKTERAVLNIKDEIENHHDILSYLNRLSDFLFLLSRVARKLDKRTENIYIPKPEKN